jgi:hypothetical protein
MTMQRHGAELHVLRPDRVYATSVLSPIVGYNPGADVMAVAQNFTSRGYNVPTAGMSLSLGAPPLNFFQRLRIRIAAASSERRARRMLKKLAKLSAQNGTAAQPPMGGLFGPEPARQGMALVAARISVGQYPMPAGARTKLQAGTAIIPSSSGIPRTMAQQAVAGSPTYVAQRAAAYGYGNWANKRRNWFDV